MSNGSSRNESVWPLVTIIIGIVAVAAVAWDVMLQKHNQALENRLQKMETRVDALDGKGKAAEAAAAKERRRARAATAGSTTPEDKGTAK